MKTKGGGLVIKINEGATLQYVSSGLFSTTQKWIHPRRSIDSFEIIYVTHGDIYIEEDCINYHLKRGDALLLEPEKIQR